MKKVLYGICLAAAIAAVIAGALGLFGCTAQAQAQPKAIEQTVVDADTAVVDPNIGKAYSPRQLFVESFPIEGVGAVSRGLRRLCSCERCPVSIWIPSLVTLVAIAIFLLLVYPGKLRAEASVLAFIALAFITFLAWIAYGVMNFYNAFWH